MVPRDLRTGAGIVDPEGPDREVVTATLLYFMELAARCAAAYTRAAGRTVVRERDILRGLKLQALPSTGFVQREDLRENVLAYVARLREGSDSDDDDDADAGGGEAEAGGDAALVARMDAAPAAFERWEPARGTVGFHVKRAIRKAEAHLLANGPS